ncbi:hypothetical protein BJY01DRAFT_254591 [Aspergillus pseudoustus]|uniref:Uncharacterized protein n=1 Tax=Aspergillus pseudoustus TaxID=1810923 RepID=A0ABR4ITN7_9EURO
MILPAESHIWRWLFRDSYDDKLVRSAVEYKNDYQVRELVLSQGTNFRYGQGKEQTFWLALLNQLILEALVCLEDHEVPDSEGSKNLIRLEEALAGTEFLNRPVNGYMMSNPDPPSDLFCAIQLHLTFLALDPSISVRCLRADYDIGIVYPYFKSDPQPFTHGYAVSPVDALHIRNFWVRHLVNPDEATFYTSYMSLPEHHRPSAPKHLICCCKPELPTTWLGYESCICPPPVRATDLNDRQTCADLSDHIVEVEYMTLHLEKSTDPENWPPLFSECIYPLSGFSEDHLFFRGMQTYHGSGGERSTPIRGFLEHVYGGGIRGSWSHIAFVAYERPAHLLAEYEELAQGQAEDQKEGKEQGEGEGKGKRQGLDAFFNEPWPPLDMIEDFDSIYGYEGVIVPEGTLIVGHWMDVRLNEPWERSFTFTGPFIFWCI